MGKAERTKQFIIEQAAPIFNEKGIAGTSVDDVLKAAKVAKGCLYNHFENKEALANETIDYLFERTTSCISLAMSREKTAKGKIHAYLDYNKDPFNTITSGGCPILNMAIESDDNSPVIKEKTRKVIITGQKGFSDILLKGIEDGEYSSSLNTVEFAFKMFAAIEGATMMCRILGSNKSMLSLIKGLKKELSTYQLT